MPRSVTLLTCKNALESLGGHEPLESLLRLEGSDGCCTGGCCTANALPGPGDTLRRGPTLVLTFGKQRTDAERSGVPCANREGSALARRTLGFGADSMRVRGDDAGMLLAKLRRLGPGTIEACSSQWEVLKTLRIVVDRGDETGLVTTWRSGKPCLRERWALAWVKNCKITWQS